MFHTTINFLNGATGTTAQFQRSFPYLLSAQAWVADALKWLDGTGFALRRLSIVYDALEVDSEP